MRKNLELFTIAAYSDRLYFLPTSTRTKRPIKRAAIPAKDTAAQTQTN